MKTASSIPAVIGLIFAVECIGCGSTPPPKELIDARTAYDRAQKGKASQLNPVQLHDAKLALDAAEAAFNDDATSEKTRDLSYVAERKSDFADSQGSLSDAVAKKDQASKDLASLQSQDLARTKQGLAAAQGELSKTKEQLHMTADQLAAEKKAREAAEKRARDAMDKLGVAAALAVKEEPRGTVITIPGSVLFPSGKYDLLPDAQEKLNAVAEALKNQEDHSMVVEGHTDSQGSETSNLELSQKRAQSVRDYLVSRGVASDKITSKGIGEGRPIADNKSADGRAQNRRVEIIVQPIERR